MKKTFFSLALALLGGLTASAQMIAYDVQTTTAPYEDVTGGNVVDLQGTTGKDFTRLLLDNDGNLNFNTAEDVTAFPIGFDFAYNGKQMKYFLIGTDGEVLLSDEETVTTDIHQNAGANLLSNNNYENFFGLSLRNGYYGLDDTEISYKTEGEAGSRVLTIQYKNVGLTTNSNWNADVCGKAQVQYKLYEATGNLSIQVNGFNPTLAEPGNYNFIRLGIVGDKGDWLLVTSFDGANFGTNTASITYTASSYPADGTTYTFVAPEPCETPVTAPTDLALTSTSQQVSGTFTIGSADYYVVLATTDAELTEKPTDRTKYTLNQIVGNATVIAVVEAGEFTSPQTFANLLTPGTKYNVFVYGYNSKCANGPLYNATPATASITTKPAAPAALTVASADKDNLSFTAQAPEGTTLIVAFTTEQYVNPYNQALDYGVFGTPAGTAQVGNQIDGGGTVVYVGGTTAEAVTVADLAAGKPYFLRAWSVDAEGGVSTIYLDVNAVTAAELPWSFDIDSAPVGSAPLGWGEEGSWSSNSRSGYFYSITNGAAEGTFVESWRETSDIYLAEGANRVKINIAATEIPVRFASDWTMKEGDVVAVQVTQDGVTYKDIISITKDNAPVIDEEGNGIWQNGQFVSFNESFTDYAGEKVRFRIYIKRQSNGQVQFRDFIVEEKPAVAEVTDVKTVSVDGGNVTLGWTAAEGVTSWQVSYRKAGDEEWSEPQTVTEPTITLNGLLGLTKYEVRVLAVNAEGKQSPWSEAVAFTTGASAPFEFVVADADDLTIWKAYTGVLSENTTLEEGGDFDVRQQAGWGGMMMKWIMYNVMTYSAKSNSWLVSPAISLGSDATKTYQATLTLTGVEKAGEVTFKVVVAKDGENFSEAGVIGTIAQSDLPDDDATKDYTFDFTGYSGSIRLGYYIEGDAEPYLTMLQFDKMGLQEKDDSYQFVASEWPAGDAGRISPDNVTVNADNTITVSQTGQNNVALIFRSSNHYTVKAEQRYFVIKATGLSTAAGASYLWWLNNTNNGSQIEPTSIYDEDGVTVFAWDAATIAIGGSLGLADADFYDAGGWSTTFGMTLADTSVPAVISYIGFEAAIDQPVEEYEYVWDPTLWVAGDAGRISPSNVVVDEVAQTITVDKTGDNNVALLYKSDKTFYVEGAKYFVIQGTGLSVEDGKSYLWWLNGSNNGTQVAPTAVTTDASGLVTLSWTISETGLGSSFATDRTYLVGGNGWNTTFGLTLADDAVPAVITYIGFDKEDITTGIEAVRGSSLRTAHDEVYDLQGRRIESSALKQGLYIINGKKVVIK